MQLNISPLAVVIGESSEKFVFQINVHEMDTETWDEIRCTFVGRAREVCVDVCRCVETEVMREVRVVILSVFQNRKRRNKLFLLCSVKLNR